MTVRGLVVELFANEAGAGAIWANYDWLVENNEVRLNHAVGDLSSAAPCRNNYVHHNGQAGITSLSSTGMLVENNEIAYNNYAGFDVHYDGGGTKFMKTVNLTLRGNNAHHNVGAGLWLDWDNKGALIENNTADDNDGPGIFHEAGYDAIIRNNTIRRNGFNYHSGWIDGSGILLLASNNTEIYGNRVERNKHGIGLVQTNRGNGLYGPHETHDVYVHDNTISTVSGGVAGGLVQNLERRQLLHQPQHPLRPQHLHHLRTRLLGLEANQRQPLHQQSPMARLRHGHQRQLLHRLLKHLNTRNRLSTDGRRLLIARLTSSVNRRKGYGNCPDGFELLVPSLGMPLRQAVRAGLPPSARRNGR